MTNSTHMAQLTWPWITVPDTDRAKIWAGRSEQKKSFARLINRWQRRPKSEINVIWADFGQGKTHTLLHLLDKINQNESTLVHYVQLPPMSSGSPFVNFYKQFMLEFPIERVAEVVFERFKKQPMQIFNYGSSLERSVIQLLWMIRTKSQNSDVAINWIRGERVPLTVLRKLMIGDKPVNIPASPTKAADCQNVLDTIIKIFTDLTPGTTKQFVLLLDEFQRIAALGPKKGTEFCDSLHLIYNKHPQHLQFILAFATGAPEMINSILTPDLRSREDSRTGFPDMSVDEGIQYFAELLSTYGYTSPQPGYFGPYHQDGVREVLEAIIERTELTPRRINVIFDQITNLALDEKEAINLDENTLITSEEIRTVFSPSFFQELLEEDETI